MALIALVYHKSPGSTIELAKLLFFIVIPVFVIGPIAGAYVDRWNRKYTMIVSDILRGVLVLLIPFSIIFLKQTVFIYPLVFIIFSVTRFFLPSKMAIIPSIVSPDQLLVANSLSDTTRMIATVIGLGFAGILVKWVGVIGSFYIDSVSFFISALLTAAIVVKEAKPKFKNGLLVAEEAIKNAMKRSIFADIKAGFEYLIKLEKIRFVVSILFLLMSGIGAIFCVIIVFIQNSFGTITSDIGLLGMFLGIGLFAGTVFYGRVMQNFTKSKVIFTNLAIIGASIVAFTVFVKEFQSFLFASILSFTIGFFVGPIIVLCNTLVQEALPEDARGRVFSSVEAIMHLGFLVFMLLTSFLAEFIGNAWILIIIGGIFSLFGIGGIILKLKAKN